jgi:hypothetical protein
MRRTAWISRTKRQNRKDIKPSRPAWADIAGTISATAGLITALVSLAVLLVTASAFLLSCFYVQSISEAFHYNIFYYLSILDYVQFLAPVLATRQGTFLVLFFTLIAIPDLIAGLWLFFYIFTSRKGESATRRAREGCLRSLQILVVLPLLFVPAFLMLWAREIYNNAGRESRENLRAATLYSLTEG